MGKRNWRVIVKGLHEPHTISYGMTEEAARKFASLSDSWQAVKIEAPKRQTYRSARKSSVSGLLEGV